RRQVANRAPTDPADCKDGFFEAYWRRPEALLDPAVRASQSMWALLPLDLAGAPSAPLQERAVLVRRDLDLRRPIAQDCARPGSCTKVEHRPHARGGPR
ncbi:MAG: hypothetical protein M3025_05125, partial [Actinomycetota bacterium]|nr:hypothetical protein [Actinomycetota bacterium]